MKRKYIFAILLLSFCLIYIMQLLATRAYIPEKNLPQINEAIGVVASRVYAPVGILPIIYKNIRIFTENSSPDYMGVIQGFDINTNKLIWNKRVYEVEINTNIEEDVQWVPIKDMKIENDKFVIINEKLERYTLNPNTGKVLNNEEAQ